ncbi:MAG: helix-turn-helix domain-containing protein [Acidimicrobiales bacterium]
MPPYRAARERLGLTQSDVAALAGVTQPAIAAYEAGRRRPTGRADFVMNGMVIVIDGPTMTFPDERRGTVELPGERWQPIVPRDAVVRLPTRLDWSRPRNPQRNLAERRIRASTYAQVLDEGTPADIRFWIDPDALVELWPDVPVARRIRPAVAALVERLKDDPCAA